MTRSKELRRIEHAIADRNVSELRWALAECDLRQKHSKRHSDLWYRIEKRIKASMEPRVENQTCVRSCTRDAIRTGRGDKPARRRCRRARLNARDVTGVTATQRPGRFRGAAATPAPASGPGAPPV